MLCYFLQLHDHLLFSYSVNLYIFIAQKVITHSIGLIFYLCGHAIYHMPIKIPTYRYELIMVSCCYEEVKSS